MKPEQQNWTDEQWASHLRCDVQSIPKIRKFVLDNYFVGVGQIAGTIRYSCGLYRMEYAPSGFPRFYVVQSLNKDFETSAAATKYANEVFIPNIELLPRAAKIANVPVRALQMLHVQEKQK